MVHLPSPLVSPIDHVDTSLPDTPPSIFVAGPLKPILPPGCQYRRKPLPHHAPSYGLIPFTNWFTSCLKEALIAGASRTRGSIRCGSRSKP